MDPSFLRPLPPFGVLDLPRIFRRISHHTGVNDADRLDPGRSPKILQTCLVLQNASNMHHVHSFSILCFLFRMILHHIASYCQFKQQTSLDNNYRCNNRQNSPTHELDVIYVLDLSSKVFSEIGEAPHQLLLSGRATLNPCIVLFADPLHPFFSRLNSISRVFVGSKWFKHVQTETLWLVL